MGEFSRLTDLLVISKEIAQQEVPQGSRTQFSEGMFASVAAASAAVSVGSLMSTEGYFGPNTFGTQSTSAILFYKNWLREPEVFIRNWVSDFANLAGRISGFLEVYTEDITASMFPVHERDFPSDILSIPPSDLIAYLNANQAPNLSASLQTIPGKDLKAKVGAHLPEDLLASVSAHLPEDLIAFLRPGDSGTHDLSASIQQIGEFLGLSAFVRPSLVGMRDLSAKILPRCPVDLPSSIHGFVTNDLSASIITERIKNLRGIIKGWSRENEHTLRAIVRISFAGSLELKVSPIKAVVSTHTSDNLYNLDKVKNTFFENKILFGSKYGGAFKFTLEPVFGYFPDLHAYIFAKKFSTDNFKASIRASFPGYKELASSTTAVTSAININKISLSMTPLKNLNAVIIQKGAFKGLNSIIKGVVKASTSTASDAGFSTTSTSYKFLLGTTAGLVIPEKIIPRVLITSYQNSSNLPDLHATISGWVVSNLSAYIKVYEFISLSSSINAQDFSYISSLSASIASFRTAELSASIQQVGQYAGLPSSITVGGGVSDLPTFIQAYINPMSYNVVSISTKPFRDMSATINYEAFVRCAVSSYSANLSSFIKVVIGNTEDTKINLTATINALRIQLDLPAALESRKRTRIRTLSLTFRTGTRQSSGMRTIITPLRSEGSSFPASITGLSHEKNLSASVTPVRYLIDEPLYTPGDRVVRLDNDALSTNILVSFRSMVSSYVYEEISSKVFATDKGKWALDMRTEAVQGNFSSLLTEVKTLKLENILEYNTLDEAIRAGIVILTEQRKFDMPASIEVRGQIGDLSSFVRAYGEDNLGNLNSSLTTVTNLPDLKASINTGTQSSAFHTLSALVVPGHSLSLGDMSADIEVSIIGDLTASIVVS